MAVPDGRLRLRAAIDDGVDAVGEGDPASSTAAPARVTAPGHVGPATVDVVNVEFLPPTRDDPRNGTL